MNDEKQRNEKVDERPQAPAAEKPRYEKPQLRRHDQIDQVRPYGPSEI